MHNELKKVILPLLFFFTLIAKNIFFHYLAFDASFDDILEYIIGKIIFPVFLTAFLLLSRRKWWTIAFCIISDLWIISNLLYWRSNFLFIDYDVILMAGNLLDVSIWHSLITYSSGLWFFPLTTLAYCIAYIFLKNDSRSLRWSLLVFSFSFLLFLPCAYCRWREYYHGPEKEGLTTEQKEVMGKGGWKTLLPFTDAEIMAKDIVNYCYSFSYNKIRRQSILAYMFDVIPYRIFQKADNEICIDKSVITEFLRYGCNKNEELKPSSDLYIILVESLESWVLDSDSLTTVMPNLKKFISGNHVAYFDRMVSQVHYGRSMDGQMLVNTGLLPIRSGATCMKYYCNIFPNFAHFFDESVILNPWPGIWNQNIMTCKYGYKTLMESSRWPDDVLFDKLESISENLTEGKACIMTITAASHEPFEYDGGCVLPSEHLSESQKHYLSSLCYTDKAMASFLSRIGEDDRMTRSTIIITGDHTVFKAEDIDRHFNNYKNNYIPFIIYSPRIEGNRYSNEICWQMDIYPTILDILDLDGYFWKGFGTSLLSGERPEISGKDTEKLSRVSDQLIRSNYFSNENN